MEDDPREVDWAERHIKALESKVERYGAEMTPLNDRLSYVEGQMVMMKTHVELQDRVKRLESQTQFETSEDDARLLDHGRRIGAHDKQIEQMHRNLNDRLNRAERRQEAFEKAVLAKLGDLRISRDGVGVGPLVESRRVPIVDDPLYGESRATITGAAAMRQEAYDRGKTSGMGIGAAKALDNAERRVRTLLTQDGHHPDVIEAVVNALRNDGGPLPRREPFQIGVAMVSAAKPVLPARCPGELSCWAAEKSMPHSHDSVGVVHYVK